jgi:hypothetical protein
MDSKKYISTSISGSSAEALVQEDGEWTSHSTYIKYINENFEETGSVLDIAPLGRPVYVTGQNIMDEVSEILAEDGQTSIRRMNLQLNISQTSVHRVYMNM